MFFQIVPLVPKNRENVLRVIALGRVSTIHQNIENIDASYAWVEKYLATIYQGKTFIKHLGEQASGMRTDRPTIEEAEQDIASGDWDVVLMEDLSRAYRNPRHQMAFVQDCVDNETRLISVGDNLDTADPNWEVMLQAAALRHGLTVPDTRRRVRRTSHFTFGKGGMVMKVRFGYRKLTAIEAASGEFGPKGLRIAKCAEQTPIIRTIRDRVFRGDTYVAIAEWLTSEGIPPGPYVTTERWSDKLVRELLRDPILSGTRTLDDVIGKPIYKTGKTRRRPNPAGPETEHVLELAHMSQEEQQELWRVMDERGEGCGPPKGRDNPLYNRARSKSLFPAQHARCEICDGLFYRVEKDQLRCQNSLKRHGGTCWNHVHVVCELARRKILHWLLERLNGFPTFHEILVNIAWSEYQHAVRRHTSILESIDKRIKDLEGAAKMITKGIETGGELQSLVTRLKELERQIKAAKKEREATIVSQQVDVRYRSRDELVGCLEQAVIDLAGSSFDFANLLRRVIVKFQIVPVQDLTSGQVHPRAKLAVRLANLVSDGTDVLLEPTDLETTIDLFDSPVHIKHMPACVQMKREHPELSLKQIVSELRKAHNIEVNYMTVKRALDYSRKMEKEGWTEPYRVLETEPEYASRWKRRETATVELPQMPDADATDSDNLKPADPAA
jgi:hypothetical protein